MPSVQWGRSALQQSIRFPTPRRASDLVSKVFRQTHSHLRERRSRSIIVLSIRRPRPLIEILPPASVSAFVHSKPVDRGPLVCAHDLWRVVALQGFFQGFDV